MLRTHFSLRKLLGFLFLLCLVYLLSSFLCALWGEQSLSWTNILQDSSSTDHEIFFYSRLPRVLLAGIVGMALSAGGVSFQCLLRNPLADPFILGVSGGAALGSVLAMSLKMPFIIVTMAAFASAILSMFLIYWIASYRGNLPVHTLLLTGVIFNSFTFSMIMLFNSLASFEEAHRIWYMMVGSLANESYTNIALVAVLVVTSLFILFQTTADMNLLSLGEENAQSLGADPKKLRRRIFFASSLMIGACVSLSGLIGFVGLFVPHMMRLLIGSDHRLLLPGSALFGGIFLIFADTASRTLFMSDSYQTQIPVGVLTALLGGPFFVYLLKRKRGQALW